MDYGYYVVCMSIIGLVQIWECFIILICIILIHFWIVSWKDSCVLEITTVISRPPPPQVEEMFIAFKTWPAELVQSCEILCKPSLLRMGREDGVLFLFLGETNYYTRTARASEQSACCSPIFEVVFRWVRAKFPDYLILTASVNIVNKCAFSLREWLSILGTEWSIQP